MPPQLTDRTLIRMLQTLNPKQQLQFKEYLSCSLFNSSPTLSTLYDCLLERVLNAPAHSVSVNDLIEVSGIAKTTLEKSFSQLLQQLNEFVLVLHPPQNTAQKGTNTLESWQKLGLPKPLLDREYRKLKRKLLAAPQSEDVYLADLRLEQVYAQDRTQTARKASAAPFQQEMLLLETFYWVARLKYDCATVNADRIFANASPRPHGAASEQQVLDLGGTLPVVGQAFKAAYALLQSESPSIERCRSFLDFMAHSGDQVAREDLLDLYGYLLNTAFRCMTAGVPHFEELVNETYDAMRKNGLLTLNNVISGGHFKNTVSIKVRIGKIVEAGRFIQDYQKYLLKEERAIIVAYTKGLVAFHTQTFREAISCFTKVVDNSPEDLFWGFEARNMLWKSYFEIFDELDQEEHSAMLSLYHSFRLYVSRSGKISNYHRTIYLNFIRIFNRLIFLGEQQTWANNARALRALQQETQQTDHIANKQWLLSAIEKRIASL